jgi:hypothetical protein
MLPGLQQSLHGAIRPNKLPELFRCSTSLCLLAGFMKLQVVSARRQDAAVRASVVKVQSYTVFEQLLHAHIPCQIAVMHLPAAEALYVQAQLSRLLLSCCHAQTLGRGECTATSGMQTP